MKITETMSIGSILEMDERTEKVFMQNGMNCVGCPGSINETLIEAAEGHGIDLEKLLTDLNKIIRNEETLEDEVL